MTAPLGDIIVPAHDEAYLIGHSLRVLLDGLDLDRVGVVIACNGCTDGTVDTVRRLVGGRTGITVLDLPEAGKARAIAAAERHCAALPRLYVDADVGLTGQAATALLEDLGVGAVAVRPPVELDVVGATWPVRSYARIREDVLGSCSELWGAGVYGLSPAARARFGDFPDVVADDLFAARVVRDGETRVVPCTPVRVRLPRTSRALIATLTRVHRGNAELAGLRPDVAPRTTRRTLLQLAPIARDPRRWIDLAVFALVTAAGRLGARRSRRDWARDETTRGAANAASGLSEVAT